MTKGTGAPTHDPSDDAPDHPIRARIVEAVGAHPGVHKRGLRKRLDLGASDFEHHIEHLTAAGELVTRDGEAINQTICFLKAHAYLWTDPDTRILWGRHPTQPVAVYLVEHPGSTSFQVAGDVDLSPRAARHHLRKLRGSNLAAASRAGNQVHYEPTKKLVAWVLEHGNTVDQPWQKASRDPG